MARKVVVGRDRVSTVCHLGLLGRPLFVFLSSRQTRHLALRPTFVYISLVQTDPAFGSQIDVLAGRYGYRPFRPESYVLVLQ